MDFKQRFSHGSFYSLPEVERQGFGKVSRLPVSLRIVLESLVRNLDGKRVREWIPATSVRRALAAPSKSLAAGPPPADVAGQGFCTCGNPFTQLKPSCGCCDEIR